MASSTLATEVTAICGSWTSQAAQATRRHSLGTKPGARDPKELLDRKELPGRRERPVHKACPDRRDLLVPKGLLGRRAHKGRRALPDRKVLQDLRASPVFLAYQVLPA